MSGLTGIWNTDGEPVSREILSSMSARLAHRGPDGERLLIAGEAGFAFQSLHVTPESLHETQPAQHASGTVLLWEGRLDNREELSSVLTRSALPSNTPDSSIVLEAYVEFGEGFLQRLDGDFALALYDPAQRVLLLARDVMGGRTLYHGTFDEHVLFASEIKALLAHPRVQTRPNDEAVAEWLYRIPDYSDPSRTFFANIHTVPAGHVLRVTSSGRSLQRFWEFDMGKELRLKNHEDYVALYRETFSRAVQKRMRSAFPIAMTVSGGLDSSSVYCMAQELAKQYPVPKLIGIGLVPEDPRSNEVEYQSAIEQRYGIELHKIPIVAANTVNNGDRKGAWQSEGPYLKWHIWSDVLSASVAQGARVMLSGNFGDNLLTNPQYLVDLAARGRLITSLRHLYGYFQWWEGLSRKQKTLHLYRDVKGYLVPERIRPLYHRLRRRARLDPRDYIPWYSDTLIETANHLKDRIRPVDLPPCRAHTKIISHYLCSRLLEIKLDMEAKIDAEFPCDSAHPFRDRDLVALVMSMPGETVYHSGCRGIHREAMRGILPESIRVRKTKAAFMEPVRLGAISDFDKLGTRIVNGTAARLGYLAEKTHLSRCLDALRPRLEVCQDALLPWLTNDLVGLEVWLSEFFPNEPNPSEI